MEEPISNVIVEDLSEDKLLADTLSEVDVDKTRQLVNLFNANESKKSMVRLNKLNTLYDNITTQMIKRFDNVPDNFSNDDLVKFLKVTQDAIEKTTNLMNKVNDAPEIQLQQNNQVNITVNNNGGQEGLDRASRDRILDVVKNILKQNQLQTVPKSDDEEIDDDVLSEDLYRIEEDDA